MCLITFTSTIVRSRVHRWDIVRTRTRLLVCIRSGVVYLNHDRNSMSVILLLV